MAKIEELKHSLAIRWKKCLALMEGVKLGQAMIEGSPGWRFREFGTALRLRKQLKVIGKANNVMMMVYDECLKTCLKAKIKADEFHDFYDEEYDDDVDFMTVLQLE